MILSYISLEVCTNVGIRPHGDPDQLTTPVRQVLRPCGIGQAACIGEQRGPQSKLEGVSVVADAQRSPYMLPERKKKVNVQGNWTVTNEDQRM